MLINSFYTACMTTVLIIDLSNMSLPRAFTMQNYNNNTSLEESSLMVMKFTVEV